MNRYGFLGIGNMGRAMVANLLNAGFEVTVWNRTGGNCTPLVDMGAMRGASPAAVVAASDITFAMVSDPAAAEALCFGSEGVLVGMGAGKGYVDVSTVDPEASKKIGKAVEQKGGRFLEAPVFGSRKPAEEGDLVFLCAGDESLFIEAGPALSAMGRKSFYFSRTGQGAEMKLIINMIMGAMMTAFAEGLALGEKVGLSPADVLEVLAQVAINSSMFQQKGQLMVNGDFSGNFPVKYMQKDLRLALQMGDRHAQPLYTVSAANNCYLKARSSGLGEEDFSAILKVFRG